MKDQPVKGFRDYTGDEAIRRAEVRKIIVETFERYGFEPAETPVVEYEEFVAGDNKNDEAVSDTFKLKDKGKRKLALRYEFTFQLKRIMKNQKLPWRRYEVGEVFRDEPVSANRLRQFTQCDADIVGSTLKDDAEILAVVVDILGKLGITAEILVNNRKLLNEILEDLKIKTKDREQVLREIDKYDKLPEKEIKKNLKKLGAEKVLDALKKGEKYFSQFESYKEIIGLIEYCKAYGFRISFSPTVIRGLSYYDGNIFEIKAKGVRETIVAGGDYKFNGTQCTGISFGLDRISALAKNGYKEEKIMVLSIEQDRKAIELAQRLRNKKNNVVLFYGKPSKALGYANSKGIEKVIFVGSEEIKKKKFKVKDMKSGKESFVTERDL